MFRKGSKIAKGLHVSRDLKCPADSHAELAKHLGVDRSRVSVVLNLLKLDEEIKEFILGLSDGDVRLKVLNERRLRLIALVKDREVQKEQFWKILNPCPFRVFSRSPSAQNDGQTRTLRGSPVASSQRTRYNP